MVRRIKRRKVQTVVQQPTTSIWIDSTEPDDQQHQKVFTNSKRTYHRLLFDRLAIFHLFVRLGEGKIAQYLD